MQQAGTSPCRTSGRQLRRWRGLMSGARPFPDQSTRESEEIDASHLPPCKRGSDKKERSVSRAEIFVPPGSEETGRRMELFLALVNRRVAALRSGARCCSRQADRERVLAGVSSLVGQREARTKRKIQHIMRQSEWISVELHGTGSETHDEKWRPDCTEGKSNSNRTCCDLRGFPASLTVSSDPHW